MTSGAIGTVGGSLRPLSVGETLDRAFNVYRRNAVTLWMILAAIVIPIQIIQVILRRIAVGDVTKIGNTFYKVGGGSTGGAVALLIVAFLSAIAILIANGATVKAVGEAYLGHTPDWRTSLSYAAGRLGPLLILSITYLVIVGISVITIIGWIFLIVAWCVSMQALMLEGKRGFASLGRSFDLVRGRWWATFGRLLAALVVYVIAALIIGAIAGAIANGFSSYTAVLIVGGIFNVVTNILFIPFVAAVLTVIYIDLRVRKEAFDIEMLAQSVGAPAPLASPVGGAPPAAGAPTAGAGPGAGAAPGAEPAPPAGPPGSQPPPS
jgi:hypothetical protein